MMAFDQTVIMVRFQVGMNMMETTRYQKGRVNVFNINSASE